jgi:photosystem II stability/assembly factor-like uncharacterized protein
MHAVTGGSFGYVAVGGLNDPTASTSPIRPAVWTSADGKTWTVKELPLPSGVQQAGLHKVVAKGTTIVAFGAANSSGGVQAIAYTSTDGGRTWANSPLPGSDAPSIHGAALATANGFVLAGSTGSLGDTGVVLWTSADGRTWQKTTPQGSGLSGNGEHRLTALTARGGRLLGTGITGDYLGEHLTLWERPLP